MKHAEIAKALTKAVEPFVRDMTTELVAIAAQSIAGQLDAAKAHAIMKLREQLEGTVRDDVRADRVEDRPVVSKGPRSARARRARVVPADAEEGETEIQTSAPLKKTRAKMKCGNCGAIGFRSDSCGRTHNVGEGAPSEVDTSPRPTSRRHIADRPMPRSSLSLTPPYHCRPVGSVHANRSRRLRTTHRSPAVTTRITERWAA